MIILIATNLIQMLTLPKMILIHILTILMILIQTLMILILMMNR